MLVLGIFSLMTAVALPNVNISPVLLTRVVSIVLLYAAALSYNALDIQAIGSGVGIYSELFQVSSMSQSIDTFILFVIFGISGIITLSAIATVLYFGWLFVIVPVLGIIKKALKSIATNKKTNYVKPPFSLLGLTVFVISPMEP